MITAEKAIITYVNRNITALTVEEEEGFLDFLNKEVIVRPKNVGLPQGTAIIDGTVVEGRRE